jgi:hypothetical protein
LFLSLVVDHGCYVVFYEVLAMVLSFWLCVCFLRLL